MTAPIVIATGHPFALVTVDTFGGNCPVQGFGTVAVMFGEPRCWYFRARGEHWSVTVGDECPGFPGYVDSDGADLDVTGWHGTDYAAGCMDEAVALQHLADVLGWWLDGARGVHDAGPHCHIPEHPWPNRHHRHDRPLWVTAMFNESVKVTP